MSVASIERRRTLARALHEPRARFQVLHDSIERYRERAAAIFERLAELEAGNDDVGAMRRALLACSEQIEAIARLVGAPPAAPPPGPLDWLDTPTLPRKRR